MYIIRLRPLLMSLGTSLGSGLVAVLLSLTGFSGFEELSLPPGTPSGWGFGTIWTLLYGLMGVSGYLIWQSNSPGRRTGLRLYAVQLLVNFLWMLSFFTLHWFFLSFLWLVLLGVLASAMLRTLRKLYRPAAYLQVPYCVWLIFLAYLNLGAFLLN